MSVELETLDQISEGGMPMPVIRGLYPNLEVFKSGIHGLLSCGDVRLLASDGSEVPHWKWRVLFSVQSTATDFDNLRLEITEQGARKL